MEFQGAITSYYLWIEWRKHNSVKDIKTSCEPMATSKNRKEAVAYLNDIYDSLKDAVKKHREQ
jgi:hypothetical protein